MRSRFKVRSALVALGLWVLVPRSPAATAISDKITREIRYEEGVVWVEDRLSVHEHYAFRERHLDDIFNKARENETNLTEEVRGLLEGEALSVQNYVATLKEGLLDLRVLSKLTFKSPSEPARLRWTSFLGGQTIGFPKGSIGRNGSGLDVLIFDGEDTPVLWFPDLGLAEEKLLVGLDERRIGASLSATTDIEYHLRLRMDNRFEELFAWRPGEKLRNQPGSDYLRLMNRFHPISFNDLSTLVNDLQVAKSGYYLIHAANSQLKVFDSSPIPPSRVIAASQGGLGIDGSFEARKGYKEGWKETGGVGFGGAGEDIDIKEFYYRNDKDFIYLFFKCRPTVQERYDKLHRSGIFAYLYIDSDSDRSTGASQTDDSGNSAMLGTDIQIWMPLGVFTSSNSAYGDRKGCSISYAIKLWDPVKKDFAIEIRQEDSKDEGSLIAHGKDGVEVAIPLADLKKTKGDKFDFVCVEWANNRPEFANRISIKLE